MKIHFVLNFLAVLTAGELFKLRTQILVLQSAEDDRRALLHLELSLKIGIIYLGFEACQFIQKELDIQARHRL
jgi:hypothetical protein